MGLIWLILKYYYVFYTTIKITSTYPMTSHITIKVCSPILEGSLFYILLSFTNCDSSTSVRLSKKNIFFKKLTIINWVHK